MTSFLLSGYFGLANGRRVSSENPNTHKTTHHVLYDTVIQTSGVDISAEIRTWSPANEALLPDGTVVDVLGKVSAPPNGPVWIDVIQLVAFPGDASSLDYEDKIPERPFPTFFVLGHTSSIAEIMDDTVSVGYFVTTSDYVRDQARSSRVYCRFDGGKPRWKKTPRPQPGVPVFVIGLAHGLHLSSGSLLLDVDQVQLNVGGTSSSASAARAEPGGPPAKRRKFPVTSTSAAAKTEPGGSEPQQVSAAVNDVVLPPPEQAFDSSGSGGRPATKQRRVVKKKLVLDEAEEE